MRTFDWRRKLPAHRTRFPLSEPTPTPDAASGHDVRLISLQRAVAATRAGTEREARLEAALYAILAVRLDTTPGVTVEQAVSKARIAMRGIAKEALSVQS